MGGEEGNILHSLIINQKQILPQASSMYLLSPHHIYLFLGTYHYMKLSYITVRLFFYSLPSPPPEYKL